MSLSRPSLALDVVAQKLRSMTDWEDDALMLLIPTVIVAAMIGIPLFAFGSFVVGMQADAYMTADVAGSPARAGSIAAHVFTVAALVVAVLATHRSAFRLPVVPLSVAGVLLVGFAVLPALVGGQSWLSVMLSALVAVLFDLLAALLVSLIAMRFVRPHGLTERLSVAQPVEQPTGTA